jgi:hypothetical protein
VDFRTEDQDGMRNTLQVRWTITPKLAPQPWVSCSGCGGLRAFESSDKIRLNANGRRLDAWLIYKCARCDSTWNRTIFERKNVRNIDSITLDAVQSNDPDWIRAVAFDLHALKRETSRIDEFAACDVRKELLSESPGWEHVQIEFATPLPVSTRLDRLLASELKMSRSRLSALHEAGLLKANPDRTGVLRRRIRERLRMTIDLSDLDGREPLWKRLAVGENR